MSERGCVLVLGAQGFIGTALRRRLAAGYDLLSVDVRPLVPVSALTGTEGDPDHELLLRYDLGERDQIDEMFEQIGPRAAKICAVVHLAAYYDFLNKPNALYERLQSNLGYLVERIEALVPASAPFIYASSMAAMAPTEPGTKLTPESPRLEGWAYPKHKVESERLLENAGMRRVLVELVLSGVYSDMCELVPLFQQIERVRRGVLEAYFYPGETDRGLTYVHLEDCVDAFMLAISAYQGKEGVERLLIGEPEPMTYEMIHEAASRAFHDKVLPTLPMPRSIAKLGAWMLAGVANLMGRRRFIQSWMIQFAGEHFEFDLSATREALGWEPKHLLRTRIGRMLSLAANHAPIWLEVNGRRPF